MDRTVGAHQARDVPPRDRALACLVAVLWGVNFPATELALAHFPPLLLVALRFALVAVPTVLLVPRPQVPVRWLVGYGAGFGVLQFLFLYTAMDVGMPPGLASLVLQSSAPFTVLLGALLLRERLTPRRAVGVGVAVAGLAGIAVHRAADDGGAPVAAVLLTLAGGLGWALGNLSSRLAAPPRPLHLVLWMSVVPPVPMAVASLLVEGPDRVVTALTTATASSTGLLALLGLAYVVLLATLVGSGLWTALLARHPSGVVAPFSMLVPVAGISSSWLLLGDRTPLVEVALGGLVVAGVLLGASTWVPRRRTSRTPVPAGVGGAPAVAVLHSAPGPDPAGRDDVIRHDAAAPVPRRTTEEHAMATTGPKPPLRERALSALTFFYGPAEHRDLPVDPPTTTGADGEDVGEGYRRRGERGHHYVTRDDRDADDRP